MTKTFCSYCGYQHEDYSVCIEKPAPAEPQGDAPRKRIPDWLDSARQRMQVLMTTGGNIGGKNGKLIEREVEKLDNLLTEAAKHEGWRADSLKAFRDKFGVESNCQALDKIDELQAAEKRATKAALEKLLLDLDAAGMASLNSGGKTIRQFIEAYISVPAQTPSECKFTTSDGAPCGRTMPCWEHSMTDKPAAPDYNEQLKSEKQKVNGAKYPYDWRWMRLRGYLKEWLTPHKYDIAKECLEVALRDGLNAPAAPQPDRLAGMPTERRDCDCSKGDIQCSAKLPHDEGQLCCRFIAGHNGKHQTMYVNGEEWDEVVSTSRKEYKHFVVCNGDRRYPAGEPGHSCSCFNEYHTRKATAPPLAALRALAEKWREEQKSARSIARAYAIRDCADELTALLAAAEKHE